MFKPLLIFFTIGAITLMGCNNKRVPNISGITVQLEVQRFEKDFFNIDTNQLDNALLRIADKYPNFYFDFRDKVVGLADLDSLKRNDILKKFIRDYNAIYDSTTKFDKEIEPAANSIKKSLQYVKYYFPNYQLPKKLITFVGPIDAFAYGVIGGSGEIITQDALCTGLQLHLGSDARLYKSDMGQQLYPDYISRKFSTDYIASNCIKNIIDDIYPFEQTDNTLLDILIDHGKRMYLLDLFMPFEKEEIKIGYSSSQLKAVKENEGFIWNYFSENNLLYEKDYLRIRSFVTDGPMTSEFGLGSPGFISLFIGKQIINAYMEKFPNTQLEELLNLDAKTILASSKYRPK